MIISWLFYKAEEGFVGGINVSIKIDIQRNQIFLRLRSLF